MFKLNFRTPGRHGYSVQFSPFTADRLVCAACENYGIQGKKNTKILRVALLV